MTARLTRQEMKRDRVMESIGSFVHYLWSHPKGILMSLGAVLVVAAAWVGVVQYRSHRSEQANTLLAEALESLQPAPTDTGAAAGDPPAAAANDREAGRRQLQRVVDEYGSTGAAAAARLLLAEEAASAGNVERAVELWNEIGSRQHGVLAMEAELNLIEHLRASGQGEAVVERLRRELDQDSGALPEDAVMGELAATLEKLGRTDEAETVRQRLRRRHPQSPWLAPETAPGQAPVTLQ